MMKLYKAGCCHHPERITDAQGSWRVIEFPAMAAAIEHPTQGIILYDTGYAKHFAQHTRKLPYSLYPLITPVRFSEEDSLANQLANDGIAADDVRAIIISHYHGDHIAGLRDFPKARLISSRAGYEHARQKRGLSAVMAGFVPGLLPEDFEQRIGFSDDARATLLPPELTPFRSGRDLFGDGSLLLIDLPGHARGQLGLLTPERFLVADAAWSSGAYRRNSPPSRLANLIADDSADVRRTLDRLHELHLRNPQLRITPSHCSETWEA